MIKATFNETLTELIGNDVYTVEVLEYSLDFTAHILATNAFDAVNTAAALVNGDKDAIDKSLGLRY